jgi:diaminopimelate epimerase
MTVKFQKYQGAGNDFIMIDNRAYGINKDQTNLVRNLCDRKFGIGADGLILLTEKISYDFEMVYFNSDGNESSMCGNGGRCLIKFAQNAGLIDSKCRFWAIDGEHEGEILADGNVSLKMKDVDKVEKDGNNYILNTGSPHYVIFVEDAELVDIKEEAWKVRYSQRFEEDGINVNFAERDGDNGLFVRTYERGVEDETLSCGTGVVASSLAFAAMSKKSWNEVNIETPGGNLKVKFEHAGNGFKNIYLIGPAEKVFEGSVEVGE